ncbi:MAG: AAA family ATPase, partial [Planctomycetota bacterium]|nr:AAA family ATPase [Planctomycetota bacterium]
KDACMNFADVALTYVRAGLCTLPAKLREKRPALQSWKAYQERLPYEAEVVRWFDSADAMCLVTGQVSGNLEMLDFDLGGELFTAWYDRVLAADADLIRRLVIEQSPSGGWHVVYRCESPVSGNLKLAQRKQSVDGPDEVTIAGKSYKPRKDADGNWSVLLTLIETRGEGGLFLCAPSPRYELLQGDFSELPVLTETERELLLEAAWSLNEQPPEPEIPPASPSAAVDGRPGDDFNQRGDLRDVLRRHGWSMAKSGDNEYWRRPGKTEGWSATLKNGVFYVFSSNAAPFEPDKAYSPFSVLALLEHNGDFAQVAAALRSAGYGSDNDGTHGVDLSGILGQRQSAETTTPRILTPKALFGRDFSDDPNTLLGKRWLCRSGSCLVVGQTGIGKSSFSVQAAVLWALGEPLFGIEPIRPLKSLVIQAENDAGDLAEMFSGVIHGIGRVARLDDLDSRIVFVTETAQAGKSFHSWARLLIQQYQPDLVWIDPLFAFLGGSASDQETVSAFLRNGLGAIAQETGCTWMVVHHANKPPKDPTLRSALLSGDYSYLGAGSAELANWARAVLVLREVDDSIYELRASKRGKRAGLEDSRGEQVTRVFLRHGEQGICWERYCGPDAERLEARAASQTEDDEWTTEAFVQAFIREQPKTRAALQVEANAKHLTDYAAEKFIEKALVRGLVHRWTLAHNRVGYATVPQPALDFAPPEPAGDPTKREQVSELLRRVPAPSTSEIVERCGVTDSYVRRIRRELGEKER